MDGYPAKVVEDFFGEAENGFLEVRRGEDLEVTFVGTAGDEEGWVFARDCVDVEGWLPASAIRTTAKRLVTQASGSGYLTPVLPGENLKVLHVGRGVDEEGWVYAQRIPCKAEDDAGWLKISAFQPEEECIPLPPQRPCPIELTEPDHDVEAVSPPNEQPCPVERLFPNEQLCDGLKLVGHAAPENICWSYPLVDSARRSYVGYLRSEDGKLDAKFQRTWLQQLNNALEDQWHALKGPPGSAVRTAWLVDGDCRCQYKFASSTMQPSPWPHCMHDILLVVMPLCGIVNRTEWPNSCFVVRDNSGSDSLDWQADHDPLFRASEYADTCSITLSLGQTRNLQVKVNSAEATEQPVVDIALRAGDLLTMEGLVQQHYKHQVPKGAKNLKGRISLTWRWIVQHRSPCPHTITNIGGASLGSLLEDRTIACAGGCGFKVHTDPVFGGYCCRACAWRGTGYSQRTHGRLCERLPAAIGAPIAPAIPPRN